MSRLSFTTSNLQPFQDAARERQDEIQRSNRLFSLAQSSLSQQLVAFDHEWVLRSLLPSEIITLRGPCCRCVSTDWSKLRLMLPNNSQSSLDQSHVLEQLISDNVFSDMVVIGIDAATFLSRPFLQKQQSEEGEHNNEYACLLPIGIKWNGVISNCILEPNTHVFKNSVLSQTHLGSHSAIFNCGVVSTQGALEIVNKLTLDVGAESGGGRQLSLLPESTMMQVGQQLGASRTMTSTSLEVESSNNKKESSCVRNIISLHCIVRDTPTIQNVCLGRDSCIVAATLVSKAVLFPTATIGNACSVRNVILQWDASIMDHSTISNAFLMEHAHAGPNSVVVSTLLGPDVHVSAGEVHASVVGPNTNAHHQSLLIGVLWPLGRGNVGYGANVGSNHTGRIPDQETCSGEGTFWGLSCVIKFPVDLSLAPYSIVAAGTNLPPQRITMPFSLIVTGSTDANSNDIIPGWVLQSSPYTILRSEHKYATRRKAQRHAYYTGWKIIRPDTIDLCRAARHALQQVESTATPKSIYKTDRDVVGIGQNILSERGRQSGIQAYTECIQRYALSGFLVWIEEQIQRGRDVKEGLEHEFHSSCPTDSSLPMINLTTVSWPVLPWESSHDDPVPHQVQVLRDEFPVSKDVVEWAIHLLHTLVQTEQNYAKNVYKCKQRDDVRGAGTIPGYSDFHVAADDDNVIVGARKDAAAVEERARTILDVLASTQRSRL